MTRLFYRGDQGIGGQGKAQFCQRSQTNSRNLSKLDSAENRTAIVIIDIWFHLAFLILRFLLQKVAKSLHHLARTTTGGKGAFGTVHPGINIKMGPRYAVGELF